MVLESKFDIKDRVTIDGDKSISGVVTMIEWRGDGTAVRYEISWIIGGKPEFTIFDEWRLTK